MLDWDLYYEENVSVSQASNRRSLAPIFTLFFVFTFFGISYIFTTKRQSIYSWFFQEDLLEALEEIWWSIKKFKTLGYEGTTGWKASKITTDQVTGKQAEFIAKENKYFANITQDTKTLDTLDQKNFSTQGIGRSVR